MEKEQIMRLWDELRMVQGTIDKIDDITFRVKSWFVTIFVAVTGYSITKSEPGLMLLNFFFIVMFYMYEITYRIPLRAFLMRSREIQEVLRGEKEDETSMQYPYLDKYLLDTSEIEEDSKWLKFFLKLKIDGSQAKRNVVEWKRAKNQAYTSLFQLRISLIYLCAIFINAIALLVLWI